MTTDFSKYIPPILAIGGLGLLAWFLFKDQGATAKSTAPPTKSGGAGTSDTPQGGGAPSWFTNWLYSLGTGTPDNPKVNPGPNVGTGQVIRRSESTIMPVFVTAGKGTPTNFFPMGQGVISTSDLLTDAEYARTFSKIQNSIAVQKAGITNAWWQPETITWEGSPVGINASNTFQSNIPVGVKHCSGPGPGAPSTDTWHIC